MKRPVHGFDRTASHMKGDYVCDCGKDACCEADHEWMDWAADRIEELEAENKRLRASIEWIGANTDSPSIALCCHKALEEQECWDECDYCGGSGLSPDARGDVPVCDCPACDGTGKANE